MAQHNTLGAAGEQFAYEFLIREGFIVRERNWTMNHLEVDIIAERNGTFHFVEVKTRSQKRLRPSARHQPTEAKQSHQRFEGLLPNVPQNGRERAV